MPNINVILSANWLVNDITGGGSQQIINRNLGNPTLAGTAALYEPFFQTTTVTATVNLPAPAVYQIYVMNLGTAGNITVEYSQNGGSPNVQVIGPGALFMYFEPNETSSLGITSLTLTASTGTIPACVMASF